MYPGTYAKTQPDKIAVHRPSTGQTLTYRQLDDRSNQLAQLFHAQGLRRGDHVALFSENHLVYFDVVWACMRSGLYLTTINRYLTAAEGAYIVDNCDARVLIASAALAESAELGHLSPRCELKLAVGGPIEGFSDYETALASQPARPLAEEHCGSFIL
jgi:long-chain acyl-CoA synthetase